jgi:hypothetical protein
MEKPEISETLAKAKALNLPEGLIVRSLDGQSFFLTKEEINRKAVTSEANAAIAKIFGKSGGGGVATPAEYVSCKGMLEWLVTHDPFNEYWRRYSAIWAEYC